jgi:hypothetical protein
LIEDKILDGYDDITKGLVSYAIFDTSCSTVLIYVNKSGFTTGIEDGDDNEVSVIFPNPFKESLNIMNSQAYIGYRIFTLQGQILKNGSLIEGENNLDVSALSAGTYLLGLYDADQRGYFRKILCH